MAAPIQTGYREARDLLIELRDDYPAAVERFRWPTMGARFNWGIDWFDEIARGNAREALVIVEEDGSRTSRTFDEMAARSDQLGAPGSRDSVSAGATR